MIALGIDVSTTKLAIAGVREDGSLTWHALPLNPDNRGARRLRAAREAGWAICDSYRKEASAVVVEIPWASGKSSFSLLAIAAVVMEAAQAAIPNAVVMDVPTPTWKLETVGHGNATKAEVMAHVRGLGYEGDDQDVADALAMAQCAGERWMRATKGAA